MSRRELGFCSHCHTSRISSLAVHCCWVVSMESCLSIDTHLLMVSVPLSQRSKGRRTSWFIAAAEQAQQGAGSEWLGMKWSLQQSYSSHHFSGPSLFIAVLETLTEPTIELRLGAWVISRGTCLEPFCLKKDVASTGAEQNSWPASLLSWSPQPSVVPGCE